MDREQLTSPANISRYGYSPTSRPSSKRDSFAAELERDPQHSTAKRQQRSQAFSNNMAAASLERQVLSLQTGKKELEAKLRERDVKIDNLENDRRFLADREQEEKEEREREREAFEADLRTANTNLSSMRRELSSLKEQLADLTDSHSSYVRTSERTVASLTAQLETANRQVSYATQERDESLKTSEGLAAQVRELEAELRKTLSGNDTSKEASTDDKLVLDELQRLMSHLRGVERQNASLGSEVTTLRARHASIEVLREEKRGLEAQVRVLSGMRDRVAALEIELSAARDAAAKAPLNASTSTIAASLTSLRHTHAQLLDEHGVTLATVRSLETQIAEHEKNQQETSLRLKLQDKEIRSLRDKLARREKRAIVAESESAFLMKLVASLKSEEDRPDHAELETLLAQYKNANQGLAADMERLSSEARIAGVAEVERVKKDLERVTASFFSLEATHSTLQETLKTTQEELTAAETSLEEAEQRLFELSGEIAGGRHVPPNTRILTFKDSPDQEWLDARRETMEKLKRENEVLLKRLGEIGNINSNIVHEHNDGLVPRESWELACREKEAMEEALKQKDKRLVRLQEVFKSKSSEFREAIATILGLKLAFYPNGQVRVTSVFDLRASFVFQPTKSNSSHSSNSSTNGMQMQLVAQGEGGPQDLPEMMSLWIEKEQCIPGFMASVTLECHDSWKKENAEGLVSSVL